MNKQEKACVSEVGELNLEFNLKSPSLNTNMGKRKFTDWLIKYLNESENFTEKKYKVLCVGMWLNHKGAFLSEVLKCPTYIIKDLANELIKAGETNYSVDLLFKDRDSWYKPSYGGKLEPIKVLNEDESQPEKIAIAKKVYEKFAALGMLGDAYIGGSESFEPLCILQDHRFNKEDYKKIKKYNSDYKDLVVVEVTVVQNRLKMSNDSILRIMENEPNIKNLGHIMLLNEFHKSHLDADDSKSIEEIVDFVGKKINYLTLQKELGSNTDKVEKKRLKL